MALFVICHQDLPTFRLPAGSAIMWMSPVSPPVVDGVEVVRGYDYFEQPEALHAKLSGSMGSAAIARHVAAMSKPPPFVTLWQYRKFVAAAELGRPTPNYPGMRLIVAEESAAVDPAVLAPPSDRELPVRPLQLGFMLRHYHRHHHLADMLRYAGLAIEVGALSPAQTMSFLEAPLLIPGGIELGTFRTETWLKDFEPMFRTSLAFAERGEPYDPADAYQRRAVSFCQERLGSWLMLERLNRAHPAGLPASIFGIMHTVTEQAVYRGGS